MRTLMEMCHVVRLFQEDLESHISVVLRQRGVNFTGLPSRASER